MSTEAHMLEASRRLAQALVPGDLDKTLERITAAAVEVLPEVDYASITVKHPDGRLDTAAPTDEMLLQLDAAQYGLREGPCYQSAVDSVHITAPFLAHDERFPRYGPIAVAAGVNAQAGLQLFDAPGGDGALNLYATRAGAFEDLAALGQLFAHQSAMALSYARQISQLHEAVETRQLIGRAVGVVMERYELDEARAFGFLARVSQDNNVKLREVAARLLEETGKTR